MSSDTSRRYRDALFTEARAPMRLVRSFARQPLVSAAEAAIAGLPRFELAELVGAGPREITVAPVEHRHAWSLGFAEQIALQILVRERAVVNAFEIGTFNGGTTRLLAESLQSDGRVVTLDLPANEFGNTQKPINFTADQIGVAFAASPAKSRISQERGDSLTFDFSPYERGFDLILVDGAHDYEHGLADSRTALRLAGPGAVILWDDFEPYWHGLVRGILDATDGMPIGKLAGTSLAVLEIPAGPGHAGNGSV